MSAQLSADGLAWMRALNLDSLVDSCTVERPTESVDAWGEGSSSYATAATVACSYAVASGSERFAGDTQVVAAGTPIVTLPAGTDVRAKDRITVAARDLSPAHIVEVMTVLRTSDEIAVRVLGTEVST